MIKYTRLLITLIFAVSGYSAMAQSTSSSPYSRFGLGDLQEPLLPQNRAMGGIAVGIQQLGGYHNINVVNPASYSAIRLTVVDIGAYANLTTLSNSSLKEKSNNFRMSHLALAIPVSKRSALSFGLLPYSDLGYRFKNQVQIDTNNVDYIYSGAGGLSKAYLGYGFGIGSNLNLGFNVSYIFGGLKQFRSTEFPELNGAINSRIENNNSVGGLNYDYGLQYSINITDESRFILGYSGTASTKLNSKNKYVATQYMKNFSTGDESAAADTILFRQSDNEKINLPLIHRFGISYEKLNKFLIGADFTMGQWSKFSIDGQNGGLNNSMSAAIGAQIIPNINSINSYLDLIDYRVGLRYDKTYITVSGTDIKQYAATFGLGLPLISDRSGRITFSKVNFSTEIGKRGTLTNNLVKENFINFSLGFTLNDKWFQKYKFD